MVTLQELQEQNRKLRAQLEAKQELIKIQQERNRLLKENKNLQFASKYGGLVRVGSSIGRGISKGATKVGKGLGKGFVAWGRKLQEAERREQMAQRKIKKVRKIKVRKKKKR